MYNRTNDTTVITSPYSGFKRLLAILALALAGFDLAYTGYGISTQDIIIICLASLSFINAWVDANEKDTRK